jgi:hypothetical protein
VADHRRLSGQFPDDVFEVVGDLPHALVGEDLGVLVGLLDGFRIVRPPRRQRGVPRLFEHGAPAVPAAGEEPEAVDEHDRIASRCVRFVDLDDFVVGDLRHTGSLPSGISGRWRRRPG